MISQLFHRSVLSLGVALVAMTYGPMAQANGRFPGARQLVVDPVDPDHILVQVTYGFITTADGGDNWDWICEEAVGYQGVYDPPVTITGKGSIVAGIFDGIAVSPEGCAWSLIGGPLQGLPIVDVTTYRGDPAQAWALSTKGMGNDMFATQLWTSPDGGETWAQAGVDLPINFLGLAADISASDPDLIYVTGKVADMGSFTGMLATSVDGGQTFEMLPVPGSVDGAEPYLSVVDPTDAKRIYIRVTPDPDAGTTGSLLFSEDGGLSFETIFDATGPLKGFALSPDGERVLVGGNEDGVWIASTSNHKFEKVSEVGVECLTWSSAGIYACAREAIDGFTIGLSTDEGRTFASIHTLACLNGPLDCPDDTTSGAQCPIAFGPISATLQTNACKTSTGTDTGGDGGDDASQPSDDGCCSVAAGSTLSGSNRGLYAVLSLLFAMGALSSRRTRRWRAGRPDA